MVEEDAAGGVEAVALAVVDGDPVRVQLGGGVGRHQSAAARADAQAAFLTAETAEETAKALLRELQGRLTALPDSSAALAGKRGELSSRETALGTAKERLLVRWRAEKARLKELEAKALPDIQKLLNSVDVLGALWRLQGAPDFPHKRRQTPC